MVQYKLCATTRFEMYFYVVQHPYINPPSDAVYPCVTLQYDNWNDYGFVTLFKAIYFDSPTRTRQLGNVKILEFRSMKTDLPRRFQYLNERFCSLGQEVEYYQELSMLPQEIQTNILLSLKDIVYDRSIYERNESHEGFKSSLLRWSGANKAFSEGREILRGRHSTTREFSFSFSHLVKGSNAPHAISFEFSGSETFPGRIMALIGKNGTGKTELLAGLANQLSGEKQFSVESFSPERPAFDNVVTISYSAFDRFTIPKRNEKFSYVYCGIRDKGNRVNFSQVRQRLGKTITTVNQHERSQFWLDSIINFLPQDAFLQCERLLYSELITLNDIDRLRLSSGQLILLTIVTDVIANARNNSLFLLDEPETHLHPNAIHDLMKILTKCLEKFNSFAVIATHNPIIIQEIPSNFVRVFERFDNTPYIRELHIESFGEDISSINDEIFGTNSYVSNYRTWLMQMAEYNSFESVSRMFQRHLGLNARMFLSTLYADGDQ